MILLSIVTVTLNAKDNFGVTAESIRTIKDDSVEWLVIDGASSDGTLNLIHSHFDDIDVFVSEPDNGIYDAMNKARERVNGRFILFLNAGDKIINGVKLLSDLTAACEQQSDVIVGDCIFYDHRNKKLCKADLNKIFEISWNMPIIHQSMLFPAELLEKFNWYDTKYQVVSDYDLLIRMVQNKVNFQSLGYPISEFFTGDYNWKNGVNSLNENYNMLLTHYRALNYQTKCYYYHNVIKVFIIEKIRHSKIYQLYRYYRYGVQGF